MTHAEEISRSGGENAGAITVTAPALGATLALPDDIRPAIRNSISALATRLKVRIDIVAV